MEYCVVVKLKVRFVAYRFLQKNKIPLLILSAGLGNVLTEALKLQEIYENEYLHVISNFFKVENGIITGYGCRENQFYIHPFNKNGLGCSNYFKVNFFM